MNIGIVIPGFSSDETDPAIPVYHNLVRALAQTENVRVLALRYPHRRDRYPFFGAMVTSLGVGQVRRVRRFMLWWDALRALRHLHNEQPFDVLHALWADESGLLAGWAGKRLGVPVIVSILGGELTRLNDIRYGLQRSALSRWTVGQALRHADTIVTTGAYAAEAIRRTGYIVPASKLHVAPMGIDVSQFYPTDQPRDPNRLLHVASLVGVKYQATLLQSVARLDPSVTLDIIGDGPERGALEALAASHGISERVRFLGSVPHAALPDHYRSAALHILSSRSESLPMTVLEAAACGLPTVSTAAGALPDYPAFVTTVPIGDDAALADAIRSLLRDAPRMEAFRQSALHAARTDFSLDAAVARLRALYQSHAR